MRTVEPPGKALRTYGRLSDLERHLSQDWWQSLFNSPYLQTAGDVVENGTNVGDD